MENGLRSEIQKLRGKGWSANSIARHLRIPVEAVNQALGIKLYGPNGRERAPLLEVVK